MGVKIYKTWRHEGASIWPEGWHSLGKIVEPIGDQLRPLWWAAKWVRFAPPIEWVLSEEPAAAGSRQLAYEQSLILKDGAEVAAKPGFLPAFADIVSGDWSILYGVADNPADDPSLLDELERIDWFAPPTAFPSAVSVAIRGIDWAYWEVFSRQPGLISAVYRHVRDVPGLKAELLAPTIGDAM